jgi:hypothetical protein
VAIRLRPERCLYVGRFKWKSPKDFSGRIWSAAAIAGPASAFAACEPLPYASTFGLFSKTKASTESNQSQLAGHDLDKMLKESISGVHLSRIFLASTRRSIGSSDALFLCCFCGTAVYILPTILLVPAKLVAAFSPHRAWKTKSGIRSPGSRDGKTRGGIGVPIKGDRSSSNFRRMTAPLRSISQVQAPPPIHALSIRKLRWWMLTPRPETGFRRPAPAPTAVLSARLSACRFLRLVTYFAGRYEIVQLLGEGGAM